MVDARQQKAAPTLSLYTDHEGVAKDVLGNKMQALHCGSEQSGATTISLIMPHSLYIALRAPKRVIDHWTGAYTSFLASSVKVRVTAY